MSLDIAMGGSTNTVLHLLAAAQEAEVPFTVTDIDRISRKVPCICKVAPSSSYHVEDVNRAGGILSIMGELARADLLDLSVKRIDGLTLGQAIDRYDVRSPNCSTDALSLWQSAPGGKVSIVLGSQSAVYHELDTDRVSGCVRDIGHAYYPDGGLCVLFGNLAGKGGVVKTAGVSPELFTFTGRARVFESQEDASQGILDGSVTAGDIVVIRYEGPKGGPGMQEMLYPTSYLKSRHLAESCALITDGRFSGGTSGLSIGHVSPEAAAGGELALVRDDDEIRIDIPKRSLELLVSEADLSKRRAEEEARGSAAYTPSSRDRVVSKSLRAYALFASSADTGAVRVVP
jgi:dihydroxy-acid dehydratase